MKDPVEKWLDKRKGWELLWAIPVALVWGLFRAISSLMDDFIGRLLLLGGMFGIASYFKGENVYLYPPPPKNVVPVENSRLNPERRMPFETDEEYQKRMERLKKREVESKE